MPPAKGRRFRSILCAVDLSPYSAKALRYAVRLAGACRGRVAAIYAVPNPLLTAAATVYDSQLIELTALANLEAFVRASVRGTAAADIRSVVQPGSPGSVVVAYARHTRAPAW